MQEKINALKALSDILSDETVSFFIHLDAQYGSKIDSVEQQTKKYKELNLEGYQRKIIDEFIESKEDIETQLSEYSYLAGIIDCIYWLKKIDLLQI